MDNYYDKYLKYKYKYLEFKDDKYNKIQKGGGKPIIHNIDEINKFSDPTQERFLNPIYGLILCECGFVQNKYFIDNGDGIHQIIQRMCNIIPGIVLPTNKIQSLKPIDFGRFLAIKYINKDKNFVTIVEEENKSGSSSGSKKAQIDFKKLLQRQNTTDYKQISEDKKKLSLFIFKLNKYIPIDTKHDNIYFWLLLYCLWWSANNDQGIKEFYDGIREVLQIINKYMDIEDYIKIGTHNNHAFEHDIFKITYKQFMIFDQEKSSNFCLKGKLLYSDCGEITAQNLINLLSWDNKEFNIELLRTGNIEPIAQLIEYYTVFGNFDKQSSSEKQLIFGKELTARDAWSYLIIYHANNNLEFSKKCDDHYYDLDGGLNQDGSKSNFFQLIQNLLNIEKWDNLIINNIISIEDNTEKGIGNIIIEHSKYDIIIINCTKDHYFMEMKKDQNINIQIARYDQEKKKLIEYILYPESKINYTDYIWLKYTPHLLVKLINSPDLSINIKIKLFKLSITGIYDSSVRNAIKIITFEKCYIKILPFLQNYDYIDDFTFYSNDFNFVRTFPQIKSLKCIITDKTKHSEDLTPLSNVTSIGNFFLFHCTQIVNLNLVPLSNVLSIGDYFLYNCSNLKIIDLSPLCLITVIGDGFMSNCTSINNLILNPLSNVTSIGNGFMSGCTSINNLILVPLSNVTSIGDDFLSGCTSIKIINLSSLCQITKIGENFLSKCRNLKNLDLTPLVNVTSIGENFLCECRNIDTIVFPSLSYIKEINDNFLAKCSNLKKLDLSMLTEIKLIGENFLFGCNILSEVILNHSSGLQEIRDSFLSGCINLTKINLDFSSQISIVGNNFMANCSSLEKIELRPLRNITKINHHFMSGCTKLKTLTLGNLVHITSIGHNFLSNCASIETIILRPFWGPLTSIGDSFLSNCTKLKDIDLSPLFNITIFNDNFLYGCFNIRTINLQSLSNLKIISNDVFSYCSKLTSIDLSPLTSLEKIGDDFLSYCDELEEIDLTKLSNLKTIGDNFLAHCTKLKSIDLSSLTSLESVGNKFLVNCSQLTETTFTPPPNKITKGYHYLGGCTSLSRR